MCGIAGMILNPRVRGRSEVAGLATGMRDLMRLSERRGGHAAGLASLDLDGAMVLQKAPGGAGALLSAEIISAPIMSLGARTTVLMGHTRHRTLGSEADNRNNHPLVCGRAVITHNGHLDNHAQVTSRYRLRRQGAVDSEVLACFADRCATRRGWDVEKLARYLGALRGRMSCVMASRACPDAAVVVRGNQPLTLRYCEQLGVVAWASEAEFLDVALGWLADWEPVLVPSGSIAVFSALSLPRFDSLELRFNRACA